jgi:hypothetical protein
VLPKIELIAVEGLNEAIIGTTLRDDREVIAYDFGKAVELVIASGQTNEEATRFIENLSQDVFKGSPAFIYMDNDQYGFTRERIIH